MACNELIAQNGYQSKEKTCNCENIYYSWPIIGIHLLITNTITCNCNWNLKSVTITC